MATFDPSKRALFRRITELSQADEASLFARPPNAADEVTFLSKCSQCGDCIKACPNNAIAFLHDYPVVGEQCDRCHGSYPCVRACRLGALSSGKLKATIDYRCNPAVAFHCQGCVDACPQAAITLTPRQQPCIDNDVCNGCGQCVSSCDFFAISLVENNAVNNTEC
ncbi:4Fe-4S binding protein [Thaumasiovibrio sp. DFM-14]|uniref:4Fe-4S binding protein n=1 Tax=Thaumasiovibrio sp. DFM-14 TaxID=3384792 RepID=UPI0039A1AF7B